MDWVIDIDSLNNKNWISGLKKYIYRNSDKKIEAVFMENGENIAAGVNDVQSAHIEKKVYMP